MEGVIELGRVRTDGSTQSRVQLDWVTLERYAELMREGVTFPAVVAFFDGNDYWLADGFHRVAAAKRADLTSLLADVKRGSQRDAKLYSLGANKEHGLPPNAADTKQAILTMLTDPEWQRWPQSKIAAHVGVTRQYVTLLSSKYLLDRKDTVEVTRNGTTYTMNVAGIRQTVPDDNQSDWVVQESQQDEPRECPYCGALYRAVVEGGVTQCPFCTRHHAYSGPRDTTVYGPYIEPTPAPLANHQLMHASKSNEWYTPARYVDAARAVMGGIDVDPASNPVANENVRAAQYFTITDDGFIKPWEGRVFLNPPYGTTDGESNQARWSRRLIEQYRAGITKEAVLLVNAVPGNQWFAPLWDFPICFPSRRIRFYNADIEAGQPTHSNALIYLGPNISRFVECFSAFGVVAGRLTSEDGNVSVSIKL